MDLNDYIKTVRDYPKPGIIFKDITPIFLTPKAFNELLDELADMLKGCNATKLVAAEARGFMLGVPLALKMNLPFVPVRKKGKLPRKVNSVSYELEYGTDVLCAHADDILPSDKTIVFDDILATGGTAEAMCKLVKEAGAKVVACAFLMELDFLKGRDKLKTYTDKIVSFQID